MVYFRFISKDWLPFQIFAVITTVLCVIGTYFIPESPKFLYGKGRYDESRQTLYLIRRFNFRSQGKDVESFRFDGELSKDFSSALQSWEKTHKVVEGSLKELLIDRVHRRNLIISVVLWIVGAGTYYIIYFQVKYLKGDIYTNMLAICFSEMFAYTACGALTQKLGTKRSYLIYFSTMVIGAVLYITVGQIYEATIPFLFLFTCYGCSSACLVNWLTNQKIFPVTYTSSTQGICLFFARCGNILSA